MLIPSFGRAFWEQQLWADSGLAVFLLLVLIFISVITSPWYDKLHKK